MPRHKLNVSEVQAKHMVLGQLSTNEVSNEAVLQMLSHVKREEFVPPAYRHCAYIDQDIDIGGGRVMIAPLTFARMLQLADIEPSCRALIIGGGNGYAAAVIADLVGHVVSIDDSSELTAQAMAHVARLHLQDVDIQQVKNMADGYALSAPYDIIFICGAIEQLPEQLISQLAIGGRLVAIREAAKGLGKGIIARSIDGHVNIREYFDASTKVLSGFEKTRKFIF
jgi:protein-L-isoaspartate(D-aspartate) O-methyltransferase